MRIAEAWLVAAEIALPECFQSSQPHSVSDPSQKLQRKAGIWVVTVLDLSTSCGIQTSSEIPGSCSAAVCCVPKPPSKSGSASERCAGAMPGCPAQLLLQSALHGQHQNESPELHVESHGIFPMSSRTPPETPSLPTAARFTCTLILACLLKSKAWRQRSRRGLRCRTSKPTRRLRRSRRFQLQKWSSHPVPLIAGCDLTPNARARPHSTCSEAARACPQK